jgi:hypothetical protein
MKVKISLHAQMRMDCKGISLEQVKKAIKFGARTKQTDGYESHYTYYSVCWKKIRLEFILVKTIKIKK